jgi:hypothetical protein
MSCFKVVVYDPALPRYEVMGQADDVGGSLCTGGKFSDLREAEERLDSFSNEDYGHYPVWIVDHRGL